MRHLKTLLTSLFILISFNSGFPLIVDLIAHMQLQNKLVIDPISAPTLIGDFIIKGSINYSITVIDETNRVHQIIAPLPTNHPKSVAYFEATFININARSILVSGSFTTNDGTNYLLNEILNRQI